MSLGAPVPATEWEGAGRDPEGHLGVRAVTEAPSLAPHPGRTAPSPRLRLLISEGRAVRFACSGRQLPVLLAPPAPAERCGGGEIRAAGTRRVPNGNKPGEASAVARRPWAHSDHLLGPTFGTR